MEGMFLGEAYEVTKVRETLALGLQWRGVSVK